MASYNELNALIDAYINRNGVQAITGQILNGVLKAMVEQLGRGYTIMGAAIPTTDPGTPDGPECYFASTPGTYTDFDGLQVVPGELALLCYTPTDGWTKATIYEGFRQVGATIDGNVGTPSVGVSYANGVLSFDFHDMKGNPGDPAGFGTIGADITGGVGTPGVSVESSGPATAKNLQFHFTNLKGETGVTSVVATVDNTTGSPACTVSLVGQQLTLAFSGLKGAQGDTGSSVDYPFTIVNNLTTDDATQALSAAQGVVLQGEITQLEAEVTDNTGDIQSLQNQMDNYRPIVIEGNVENAPDEEDITTDENDLLKFANRAAHTNYLGYVILRKGKTFASQVTVPNTIYEIRYDFTLEQDEVVTIPTGCVLNFVGGSVKSGSIVFQNTLLSGDISFIGVSASGSIANEDSCPEWFGAKRDGLTDDSDAVISALAVANRLVFSRGTYCLEKPISTTNRNNISIKGFGTTIYLPSYTKGGAYGNIRIGFAFTDCTNITFEGLKFTSVCDKEGTPPNGHTRPTNLSSNILAFSILGTTNFQIKSCEFLNMESDFFFNAYSNPCSNIIIDGWKSTGSLMPFYGSGLANLDIRNADVTGSQYSGDGDHILYIGASEYINVLDCNFNIYDGNTQEVVLLTFHSTHFNSRYLRFERVTSERCGRFLNLGACTSATIKDCKATSTIPGNYMLQVVGDSSVLIEGCEIVNGTKQNFFAEGVGTGIPSVTVKDSNLIHKATTQGMFLLRNLSIYNSQIVTNNDFIYGSVGNATSVSLYNCVLESMATSNVYLFSLRDASASLFLYGCLVRAKVQKVATMYNGTGLTNVNFVSVYSTQFINFTAFAHSINNHGGTFVNSYLDATPLVANP